MNKSFLSGLAVLFLSVSPIAHAAEKIAPYAGCTPEAIDRPLNTPAPFLQRWPEAPVTKAFRCHNDWTMVYGALQWVARDVQGQRAWQPFFSFGPDLQLMVHPAAGTSAALPRAAIGESIRLTWKTKGSVERCEAEGDWSGVKAVQGGQQDVTIAHDGLSTFVLSCFSTHGVNAVATALVETRPN